MSRIRQALFPVGRSNEAAAALCDFLSNLATACESDYFVQLRGHCNRQRNLYDPEEPWRFPPNSP
jgi:hypothetical protein